MNAWTQPEVDVVRACPLAMVGLDLLGIVHLWNPAARELFGWAEQDVLGKPCPLKAGKNLSQLDALRERVVKGADFVGMETCFLDKDGNRVDVELSMKAIHGSAHEVVGCLHVFEDIADRKEKENERNHLAAIVQSSSSAIYSWNLNRVILSWNRGAEEIYGYREEEVLGKTMDLIVPPDLMDQYLGFVQRVQDGEKVGNFPTQRLRKDGMRIWISLTLSPVRDKTGAVSGASAIAHDITKWKNFQALVKSVEREKLEGLISICASCKKVRDEAGGWNPIESYIRMRAEVMFSHGICPDCQKRLYPETDL